MYLQLNHFFKVIRFKNLLLLVLTQVLAFYFIVFPRLSFVVDNIVYLNAVIVMLSTMFVTAAGYLINDYYDVKIDLLNKPEKVIVGYTISRRYALIFHSIFNLIAIALAYFVDYYFMGIVFFTALFLWIYSNKLKRSFLTGNMLVALLTAISVYLPAFVFRHRSELLMLFALYSFFICLIREIIKDVEDMKGDAAFGSKTLPIVLGMRKSKSVVLWITVLFISIQIAISLFSINKKVILIALVTIPFLIHFLYKLSKADTNQAFKSLSLHCKILMLIGVLMMVLC